MASSGAAQACVWRSRLVCRVLFRVRVTCQMGTKLGRVKNALADKLMPEAPCHLVVLPVAPHRAAACQNFKAAILQAAGFRP